MYGSKSFEVYGLLFDVKPSQCWYSEPWLDKVVVVDGHAVQINGTFRHCSCLRVSMCKEPWATLTCTIYTTISYLIDFRLRVIKEDKFIEKQGIRTIKGGKQIGYLSLPELTTLSQSMSKKLKIECLFHLVAKLRIAQLKVK